MQRIILVFDSKVINGGTSIGHCISTLLSVVHFNFEVSEFDITTVQAATDNNIVDGVIETDSVDDQNNWRLGRADNNIIPFRNSETMKEVIKVTIKSLLQRPIKWFLSSSDCS